MSAILNALRFKRQPAPASPASGLDSLYVDSSGRFAVKDSGGVVRYLPYEAVYNVKDYGAKGDGSTNDSAAIQAALDMASLTNPGSTVYFPAGTYINNSELEAKGSCFIEGAPGAVLKRGAATQYMFKNFNSSYAPTLYGGRGGIWMKGLIFDADGSTISTACSVIAIAHADSVTFEDVTIRNVPDWHAFEISACRKVKITNCTFEGFRVVTAGRQISEAIQIDHPTGSGALPGIGAGAYDSTPCDDVLVQGCTVRKLGALGSFGRLVGSHNAGATAPHTNIRVIGNHAEFCNDYSVSVWNWTKVAVSANTFESCNGGILVSIPAAVTADIEDLVINNNIFKNMGVQNNGAAIMPWIVEHLVSGTGVIRSPTVNGNQVRNWANTTGGIKFHGSSDVVCQGNSIRAATAANVNGIVADDSALGVYHGNKIDTLTGYFMAFQNSSGECAVSGNVFNGAGSGILADSSRLVINGNVMRINAAAKDGIEVTANGLQSVITGNYIRQTVGSPTGSGIQVAAAMVIMIQTNVFSGWGTTEGAAGVRGPIERDGTLTPAMSTSQVTTANNNVYV